VKVCFWHSDKARERVLSDAFLAGVRAHGDETWERPLLPEVEVEDKCDIAVMVGVKSRELFRQHWRAGINTVMLDKGYTRHSVGGGIRAWEYWRVAVNAHHPTHYLMKVARPHDRLAQLDLTLKPWRTEGSRILFAGSSAKYHDFYQLPEPTTFAKKYIRRIRGITKREVLYRPKPSWKEAVPIDGTTWAVGGSIYDQLQNTWAVVTHGSNAVFEAVLEGVPCIVVGDAVAKPISSTEVEDLRNPKLASDEERTQWLANLAYCQWTQAEFACGEAWNYIRPQIYG
jgi:hypothetical protein